MKRVCVFAGSSPGGNPEYVASARALGAALVSRGVALVYGGGGTGLMGALADTVLDAGGEVTGIIPGPLATRELAHPGLSELCVVASMHERKALMAERSDAFIALPGGLGTVEELMEIWTWAQLGIHSKPFGLLNAEGFYDPLIGFVDRMVADGFVKPAYRTLVIVENEPETLLAALAAFRAPPLRQWMANTET